MSSKIDKTAVTALAKSIQEFVTIDGDKITISEGAYAKALPEGVTIETVNAINDANSVFFPAVVKVAGEAAIQAMSANKDITSMSFTAPMGAGAAFNGTYDKSYQFNVDGQQKTGYGKLVASYDVDATKSSRGVLGVIKKELAAQALEAFGEK